jgi:hypothetical protein
MSSTFNDAIRGSRDRVFEDPDRHEGASEGITA